MRCRQLAALVVWPASAGVPQAQHDDLPRVVERVLHDAVEHQVDSGSA